MKEKRVLEKKKNKRNGKVKEKVGNLCGKLNFWENIQRRFEKRCYKPNKCRKNYIFCDGSRNVTIDL